MADPEELRRLGEALPHSPEWCAAIEAVVELERAVHPARDALAVDGTRAASAR